MRSSLPKVLHRVCGRPLVQWPIAAARQAGAERVAVIVSPDRNISSALSGDFGDLETVVQARPDGTGGAIKAALAVIESADPAAAVIVLSGDVPLVSSEVIGELLAASRGDGVAAVLATSVLADGAAYGRIVRDRSGEFVAIVEAKDASPEELAINEINSGTYVFTAGTLIRALAEISDDNAAGEYYLPDVLPLIAAAGRIIAHPVADVAVNLGVNTKADLALVEAEARRRIMHRHMLSGVTITDPSSTWIDIEATIGPEVKLWPGTLIRGRCEIGAGAEIGPHTTLIDSRIGPGSRVIHSHLIESEVEEGCSVGPFAYLRPGAHLHPGSKAGTFVEIKKSEIGRGAKVPHLSYIGDAEVGENANLGAGTITANYDGFEKHRTKIGADARIGVDTALVAPVEVGEGAYTGAGSVISADVPAGALGIVRAKQVNVEGYTERKAKEAERDS